ncbi:MAG: hypothetical protein ACD_67C00008G0005 [uncultured bacterium]|nr:MAG: hypothetical protein ACD_67C00008G0005 [uncultured bacterium]
MCVKDPKEVCLGVMSKGVCLGCDDTLNCLGDEKMAGTLTKEDQEILREAAPKETFGFPVPDTQPCGKNLE